MTTIETLLATLVRTVPSTLLAIVAVGCTDSAEPGPQPDPGDVTSPKVVSTTPTADATGVGAGAKIEITFSEPMDRGTIEAAYASPELPLDKISMAWNADGTVLTISPDQPLIYAEGTGTDPSAVTPLDYTISIGADAADLAGNPIDAPLALTFMTKRRMFTTFAIEPSLSRTTLGGSALGEQTDVMVGDASLSNLTYRGYVSFDLAALPDGASIESASFAARQLAVEGAPYDLGPINTYHLTFSAMMNVGSIAPLSLVGVFSDDAAPASKSIETTAQVIDDVAHRNERGHLSQYRLQYDLSTDNDNAYDRATFAKGTFEMSVHYIAD